MLALSKRSQLAVGVVLVLLMAISRGSHFSAVNLPSASWAVFFLAGVLLRPRWAFPLLFLQALFMDLMSTGWASDSHCMTLAYWTLVPAYGALWFGGRLYARWHREQFSSLLILVPTVAASALVCQLFSSGGFYWLSGRHSDQTVAGMFERIATYYPQYLSTLALYVALAALVYVALRLLTGQRVAAGDHRA